MENQSCRVELLIESCGEPFKERKEKYENELKTIFGEITYQFSIRCDFNDCENIHNDDSSFYIFKCSNCNQIYDFCNFHESKLYRCKCNEYNNNFK